MAVIKVLKFKSKIHPDKVYSSASDFWADHIALTTESQSIIDSQRAVGSLVNTSSELGADGKHVIQSRTYLNQEAYDLCSTQLTESATAADEISSVFEITAVD